MTISTMTPDPGSVCSLSRVLRLYDWDGLRQTIPVNFFSDILAEDTALSQGRGWQGQLSVKNVSLAKDTTLMGVLWPFGSFITLVNNLDRNRWLSAVRCL